MHILMIHHRLPYPLHSGMDKVRFHLIRSLMTRHRVTLIAPILPRNSREDIRAVEQICSRLIAVEIPARTLAFRSTRRFAWRQWWRLVALARPMHTGREYFREVEGAIRRACREDHYDAIQLSSNVVSCYAERIRGSGKLILGPMDDGIGAARTNGAVAAGWKPRLGWKLRLRAVRHYQPRLCRRCDTVLFHSPEDREGFCTAAGGGIRALVLPTAVEADAAEGFDFQTSCRGQQPGRIVFVGGLGSAFNVDAVLYFYRELFPGIAAQVPDAHFYVVGQSPPSAVRGLQRDPRVTVTGAVPDVRPYIERAAVYIAPVRAGTGFKTKVVEALALGKAIVALPGGVQGLWELGRDAIRVVRDADGFQREVIDLLRNEAKRHELGRNARRLYEQVYAFDAVTPKVLDVYEEIFDSPEVSASTYEFC